MAWGVGEIAYQRRKRRGDGNQAAMAGGGAHAPARASGTQHLTCCFMLARETSYCCRCSSVPASAYQASTSA